MRSNSSIKLAIISDSNDSLSRHSYKKTVTPTETIMVEVIDGVFVEKQNDFAICHIHNLSSEVEALIRKNLTAICHGSRVHNYGGARLFSYKATLESFLERYEKKAPDTKMGMIGEFLSHILLPKIFDEFDVASAFFNLEEKSIKKGFDLILYKPQDQSAWITEVKSGNLHKGKDHDQTTKDLLGTAKADLVKRLNESETMYWYNAVNSVQCSLDENRDYKKTLEEILLDEGGAADQGKALSSDNCVVLVASLFEPLTNTITTTPATTTLKKINDDGHFLETIVFCIQKATYTKVVEFLTSEKAEVSV